MAAPNFSPTPKPSPTMVTGARGPENAVSGRIIADVDNKIAMIDPDAAPLVSILTGIRGTRQVTQFQYNWMEVAKLPRDAQADASGAVAGATSLTVAAGQGSRFVADTLVHVPSTGENFLVTAVSTDTLTIARGIGNSGVGAAIAAGADLQILGPVRPDYATLGSMISTQEVMYTNYTQIVRRPFGFTGRQLNTDMYGGMDPDTEKKKQAIEHKLDLEWISIFGRPHTRTGSTGYYQTFSGGLIHYLQSNLWDLGGQVPTWNQFNDWLEWVMRVGEGGIVHGNGRKFAFCAPRWLSYFAKEAYGKLEMRSEETKLGMKITTVTTPHGDLSLIREPLFQGGPFAGYMLVLDLNHIRRVIHQGRGTKLMADRQANDLDGQTFEWMTDYGIEVKLEEAHGLVRGLGI